MVAPVVAARYALLILLICIVMVVNALFGTAAFFVALALAFLLLLAVQKSLKQ